jgi:hypothetical protein
VTAINGTIQAYWFKEGYLRTSSNEFSMKDITNKMVHLTNDAVQKRSDQYGKFENGNKLSYAEFQKYLDATSDSPVHFEMGILPRIKGIVIDSVKAIV